MRCAADCLLRFNSYQSSLLRAAVIALLALALSACGGGRAGLDSNPDGSSDAAAQGASKSRPAALRQRALPTGKSGLTAEQLAFKKRIFDQQALRTAPALPLAPAVEVDAPAGQRLPDLSSLSRSVSEFPGSAAAYGGNYDSTLPSQRVSISDPVLNLVPNGNAFQNSAFAIYRFNLPDYSGPLSLETNMIPAPVATDLFIAVSDFGSNSWRWLAGDAIGTVTLPDGDYFNDNGDVLVAVLVRGTIPCTLNWLRFGGNKAPQPLIVASKSFGNAPYDSQLIGGFSTDDDGIVVKYEWDLDNNGSFELETGENPMVDITVAAAGQHTYSMRVTDDENATAVTSITLTGNTPGYDEVEPNQEQLSEDDELPTGGFSDWEGNIGSGGYDGSSYDTYLVSADSPRRLRYTFEGTAGSGLPCAMTMVDVDGQSILTGGNVQYETCVLDARLPAAGLYLLLIETLPDAGNMDYKLSCSVDFDISYSEIEDNDEYMLSDPLPEGNVDRFSGNLGADGYDGDAVDFTNIVGTPGNGYRITVEFPAIDADIDIELLAPDGSTVLASSTTLGGIEQIDFVFPDTSIYFLRTYIKAGSPPEAEADYFISVTELGAAPTAGLSILPDSGDAPLTITLDFDGSTVPAGETLAQGEVDWNNDGIAEYTVDNFNPFAVVLYEPGTHTIGWTVRLTNEASASATDTVTVNGSLDEVEPNNVLAEAQVLPTGTLADFLCSIGPGINQGGADDWYSYTADADGTMNVSLSYEVAFPFIVIGLFDSAEQLLGYDTSVDGFLQLSTPVSNGTPIYIQVYCNDDTAVTQGYKFDVNVS